MRDLRRGRGGAVRARRSPPAYDATGMYAGRPTASAISMRRLRAAAAGRARRPGTRPASRTKFLTRRRYSRPRRRRDPARRSVRLLAPRSDLAGGSRRRDRGPRLDQRDLSQRGAAERPAAAASRRSDPDRRLRVLLRAMTISLLTNPLSMLRAADTTCKTDTGRQRRDNEDSAFARAPVFVVADGMGGAQAGRGRLADRGRGVRAGAARVAAAPRSAWPSGVREANRADLRASRAPIASAPGWGRR